MRGRAKVMSVFAMLPWVRSVPIRALFSDAAMDAPYMKEGALSLRMLTVSAVLTKSSPSVLRMASQ